MSLGGITNGGGAPCGRPGCARAGRVHRLHRAHDVLWMGDLLLLQAVVAPSTVSNLLRPLPKRRLNWVVLFGQHYAVECADNLNGCHLH